MNGMSRPNDLTIRLFGWWLVVIASGALCLRVAVILLSRGEWVGGDGFFYSLEANRNAAGHFFLNVYTGQPDAIHPPAWTLILTTWALLGQHHELSQQLLSCAIGTATVVMIGLVTRQLAGDRAGLVAAAIAAVYAGLWVYERALLSETFLLLVIALVLLIAYWFYRHPSIGRAVILGALCGLLAMTRSEQILIFPLLVVPLILTARSVQWRTRIAWLVIATTLTAVVIAPWTIYNLGRFQKPVVLSTNAGATVLSGSCDSVFYGSLTGYYNFCALRLAVSSDQSIADTEELDAGLKYEEHHLTRLPLVVFAREGRAFGYWNPFQETFLDNQWQEGPPSLPGTRTSVWVYDLGLVSYWVLLVPALAGGIVLRRLRVPLYPLLAFVAAVIITVAITFGEARYRAAAEVPIVILAAIGIDAFVPWKRSSSSQKLVQLTEEEIPEQREPSS
jgi:4-amino-4-deoxy-L-arabinose transferase-like glycosyltransferase